MIETPENAGSRYLVTLVRVACSWQLARIGLKSIWSLADFAEGALPIVGFTTMGSRTRFFGTVLAMLALNTFYFRPTDPTESTDPTETEPQQEQLESPSEGSRSHLPGLEQVAQGWSRLSQTLSDFWQGASPDLQP